MQLEDAILTAMLLVGTCFSAGASLAQDAISSPGSKQIGVAKTQMEPSLIVLNSKSAKLAEGQLVLSGVSTNSIVFADRPVRATGHVLTAHLLEEWATGEDSFGKDPPNATVSVLNKDGGSVTDAVVTLRSPKLDGDTLTSAVDVLEGSLDGADGPASTFIDIIGMPLTPLSFAGAARRTAYRGAYRALGVDYSDLLLTLAIVGCVMARSGNAAEESGLGTVVPEAEMTVFCQNAAAARFEVQLDAITTDPPIARDGKLLVLGTVDSDDDREVGFDCRFEQNGAYLGIIGAPAMND